jgi:hypothetical protein
MAWAYQQTATLWDIISLNKLLEILSNSIKRYENLMHQYFDCLGIKQTEYVHRPIRDFKRGTL